MAPTKKGGGENESGVSGAHVSPYLIGASEVDVNYRIFEASNLFHASFKR